MNLPANQSLGRTELWSGALLAPICLWFAQPPVDWWPLTLIAIVPWLYLATRLAQATFVTKRQWAIVWLASALYWWISLQGLRLAHPWMFIPWFVFGGYLATYHLAFVILLRRASMRRIPTIVAAPILWVGLECVRNYLFTGISVLMLGHHVVDAPHLIQIADTFGTYGVSFVLVIVNVACWEILRLVRDHQPWRSALTPVAISLIFLAATISYGQYRLGQQLGDPLATFALIQRSEPVDYAQSVDRQRKIFSSFTQESVATIANANQPIDAVVWPESMFTGAEPWRIAEANAQVPANFPGSSVEFGKLIGQLREYFINRNRYVQSSMIAEGGQSRAPHILAGCAVEVYEEVPRVYSGFLQIGPDGNVVEWYGKTHLVMFGEYVPIIGHIPGLRQLIPPGLGVTPGPGPKRMQVADTIVAPNICIETAVERVTMNQFSTFDDAEIPDVIVTITNDGWYYETSVLDHHLACSRMVAVAARRPLLSSANFGPTAWVDSYGGLVKHLPHGTNGNVIATPRRDERISQYVRLGDWPARACVVVMLGLCYFPVTRTN